MLKNGSCQTDLLASVDSLNECQLSWGD